MVLEWWRALAVNERACGLGLGHCGRFYNLHNTFNEYIDAAIMVCF